MSAPFIRERMPICLKSLWRVRLKANFAAMDGLLYYSSESGDLGKYRCVLTFKDVIDMDKNIVAVQSAVQRAEPKLPEKIRKSGIAIFRNAADTEKFPFSWDAE